MKGCYFSLRVIFWALWLVELLEHVEKREGGGMGAGVGFRIEVRK